MTNISFLTGMQDKVNNQNNVTQHIIRKGGASRWLSVKNPLVNAGETRV